MHSVSSHRMFPRSRLGAINETGQTESRACRTLAADHLLTCPWAVLFREGPPQGLCCPVTWPAPLTHCLMLCWKSLACGDVPASLFPLLGNSWYLLPSPSSSRSPSHTAWGLTQWHRSPGFALFSHRTKTSRSLLDLVSPVPQGLALLVPLGAGRGETAGTPGRGGHTAEAHEPPVTQANDLCPFQSLESIPSQLRWPWSVVGTHFGYCQ